jgi:protoporphyrin/coproporphyrin ferrochelatase
MNERHALLVMAYGTPRTLDEVEAYYTDIRRGRPPSPEHLQELTDRYRSIGGRSPLLEITSAQARGLSERVGIPAFVGFKHVSPFIPDAVWAMAADGVTHAIGLVLAPHFSRMSVGDYERRARRGAQDVGWTGELDMIDSWHLEPGYIELLASRVSESLASLPRESRTNAVTVFTAHSLPERILHTNDPYPDQLRETAAAVAERVGLQRWTVAWQSAGLTGDEWLGPDILEVIEELAGRGVPGIVACPCGFVADHLEVLYDIDIEARELADKLGVALVRTASPNDDPAFLDMLAAVVRRRR